MTELREFEVAIEKYVSSWRKGFVGRGPVDNNVRIVADTIFIRTVLEYTPLEKMNLEFTQQTPEREKEFYLFIKKKILDSLYLTTIHFLLEINDLSLRLEENGNFFIIRLRHNIEELIKSGVAVLPPTPE